MGIAHRTSPAPRRFNLDWMLVTVGLMALALLAGSLIRMTSGGPDAQFGAQMGGLRALGEQERLILFEDLASGPDPAWSGGQRQEDQLGLGAVWMAVPPGAPLMREIILPEGVTRAFLSFDLIAIDAWAGESLEVALQGRTILRHGFSPESAATDTVQIRQQEGDGLALRTRLAPPREMGFATGDPALAEERLSVEIALDRPDPLLRLSVTPQPGTTGQAAPAWAVDNLVVIVETEAP